MENAMVLYETMNTERFSDGRCPPEALTLMFQDGWPSAAEDKAGDLPHPFLVFDDDDDDDPEEEDDFDDMEDDFDDDFDDDDFDDDEDEYEDEDDDYDYEEDVDYDDFDE
jgi:hypothetical protein